MADIGRMISNNFVTPYMAIPTFIIWLVLFIKDAHIDAHKVFEKYLIQG